MFKDSYISGEGFTKAYNLDISINQIGNTDQENIGRVVFVDDAGNFVFEYQYFENELVVIKKGMVIYPETKIRECESLIEGVTCLEFMSSEYY